VIAELAHYTIVAIDDHPLFIKGVADLLEMDDALRLVGEASNGDDALRLVKTLHPDLILLDINMKGMSGIDILKSIKQADLASRVLMLTVSDSEEDVVTALRLGADGYLLKDMEPEEILQSLHRALEGKMVISEGLTRLLAEALKEKDRLPDAKTLAGLTTREKEILEQIACGLSNKLIAKELNISEGTVKVHVKNLLKKLNQHSRVEAAVWALKSL
jgi:two-component system nitrate/nitrite response regulator NarL